MRVLMVEVGKKPYTAEIGCKLKDFQSAIGGGYIEIVPLDNDGTVLVCDSDGKLKRLAGNRRIDESVIAGNFFVCNVEVGVDGNRSLMKSWRYTRTNSASRNISHKKRYKGTWVLQFANGKGVE